jgi:O-antigen ligase/tetratricopeptide (TPR) repeat protein
MLQKFLKWVIYMGILTISFVPFMMSGTFFFPFIFTKVLVFRVAVEIMLLAYLLLIILNREYRPRINILTITFFVYISIVFISSILGGNFYLNFWSDIERGEGLLLIFHLFALFVIISSVLKNKKDWLLLFDVAILGSIFVGFVALGQKLGWDFVLNSGESRISATIGNPAFLASYLIFTSFFSLFLLFERKSKFLKTYYAIIFFLEIYLIVQTATRGAFVGLVAALMLAVVIIVFFSNTNKKIKQSFLLLMVLFFMFGGVAFANRDSSWVKNNEALRRVTDISLADRTTETRLMTWSSSWQGIKEKPLIGWGYENFYVVFNKYFNPGIYEDAGSRIWFDRAHNVIFDRLVSGGFLGLFAYMFLIFYPVYFLFKDLALQKDNIFKKLFNKVFKGEEKFDIHFSVIFSSLLVAYFIQDIFVFDVLVSYIPLIFLLAFMGFNMKEIKVGFLKEKYIYYVLFIVFLILFIPIMYMVNIKPAKANIRAVDSLRAASINDHNSAYILFLESLSYETYGNQEFRARFAEFVDSLIQKRAGDENFRINAAKKVNEELKKQILERPDDVSNYILLMRHYNKSYIYDVSLLEEVIKLFDDAVILSPTRPHLYYEKGFAEIYLGNYYQKKGDLETANKYHDDGVMDFEKAIELNDDVIDSYINAILMSFVVNRTENVEKYINTMDAMKLPYKRVDHLKKMASAAHNTKDYSWAIRFYDDLIEINPDNPQNYINLSIAYLYIGETQKAIEAASLVNRFGEAYKEKADEFIKQIQDPNFDISKAGIK